MRRPLSYAEHAKILQAQMDSANKRYAAEAKRDAAAKKVADLRARGICPGCYGDRNNFGCTCEWNASR